MKQFCHDSKYRASPEFLDIMHVLLHSAQLRDLVQLRSLANRRTSGACSGGQGGTLQRNGDKAFQNDHHFLLLGRICQERK